MIVYKVTNKINNKIYIGQTVCSLSRRRCQHETAKNTGYHFHNAIHKYGKNSFKWEILNNCISKVDMDRLEKHYINKFNSNDRSIGYNMTLGGDSPLGRRHKEESKRKMSISKTGKKLPHTDEWNRKIGEAQLGPKNHMWGKTGDKHPRSKTYLIIDPNGEELVITGLSEFCKDKNICDKNMSAVANGKRTHHKGYKCKLVGEQI